MEAPYLELQYYVGDRVREAARELAPNMPPNAKRIAAAGLVGLISEPEELECIGGVLVLRTAGDAFCGQARRARSRLNALGRIVYRRFVEAAEALPCKYGAILVEYSLEEPKALRDDPRSLAFRNFYLSHTMRRHLIDEVIALAGSDAHVGELAHGVYVSMSAEFNPEGADIDSLESQARSVRIASLLAATDI